MKSTQAWGWLAAAVVAAGLNAAYHDGQLEWAHRIADRAQQVSEAVVALASGRADTFLAETKMLSARDQDNAGVFSDAVFATAQEKMARAEAAYARAEARQEAHCARMQAEEARIEARIAGHRVQVQIPQVRIDTAMFRSIAIPAVNVPEIRIPQIEVPQVEIPGIEIPKVDIPKIKVHVPCAHSQLRMPALPNIAFPAIPAINVGLSNGPV